MYKIGQLVKYGTKAHKVVAYATGGTVCARDGRRGRNGTKDAIQKKYDVFSKTLPEGTGCWWVLYSSLEPIAILRKG